MANDVLIPTPLRVYAGKQDVVQVEGKTVGELLENLTAQYAELRNHLYNEDGRFAELRQRVPQRRRYPLPAEGSDAGEGW